MIDRRKQPSFGYRAVHVIATARDKLIEIQVRTELQHLWAQLSEKLSDTLDPGIKYGAGRYPMTRQSLLGLSEGVAAQEELEQSTDRPTSEVGRSLKPLLRAVIEMWNSLQKGK